MIQANVVEIGPEAINEKEPMLILFNNTATTTLSVFLPLAANLKTTLRQTLIMASNPL